MQQQLANLLADVATARRTLQMARDARTRLSHYRSFDGMILALVANTEAAETRLAEAVTEAGGEIRDGEHVLTCGFSDRRSTPRPSFIVHKLGDAPSKRRDAFAA